MHYLNNINFHDNDNELSEIECIYNNENEEGYFADN